MNKIARNDDQLGPYRLLSSLGKGGMAEVWKAEHRHLGQVRALKILLPQTATPPDHVGRLITEARATARLRHPAIVEVFDCDVLEDGGAFIAMEYLPGEHLRSWLDRVGKLAGHPRLAAAILGTMADGLAFAHLQGVVHRDLKPENVALVPLSPDGGSFTVKLLDFGIAKLLREEAPTKTRPGCVIGTPLYMAPEQWQPGEPIDHRTDIYALGCVFFELLCGRPPFLFIDDLSIMRAHLVQEPPDLSALEPDVPPVLGVLLSRMLAKAPPDRPADMEEVLATVESFLALPRTRFREVLRAPPGLPVRLEEARGSSAHAGTLPGNPGMVVFPPSRRSPPTPTTIAPRTEPTRQRRRPIVIGALLATVGLAALARSSWFGGGDASSRARPASAPPSQLAASIAPPAPAVARTFTVRVSSVPPGAEAWVVGETAPRGHTPLDLVFDSPGPRSLRLGVTGFRPQVLTIVAGSQAAFSAHLARLEAPRPAPRAAARRQGIRPARPPASPYQAVGD